MRRRSISAMALWLCVAACGERDSGRGPEAHDFALSLEVAAPAAQVLRVDLPAAALVAIRRPDKGDIRIVDARGRPLSMAFAGSEAARQGQARFNAIPFNGRIEDDRPAPVSVRVDRAGDSVSVRTGSGPSAGSDQAVLIDTRAMRETAVSIAPEARLPGQRPVTVSVAVGTDLRHWEPLAEHVLFRPGEEPGLLGGSRIPLPPVGLQGRYLRLSWHGEPELTISGATLFTSRIPPRPRVSIPARGLALTDAHHLDFTIPPGVMPAAMRVVMTGKDGVIPLRLLGRDNAEAPWTLLAMGSLRQGGEDVVLEMGEATVHRFRLEADTRGAGFSQVPKMELQYSPIALAVAFNGVGPYRLLVGNASAEPANFVLSDLTNLATPMGGARVIGARSDVAIELDTDKAGASPPLRLIALWSVLLLGVALLAYTAIKLMRANAAS